MAWGLRGNFGQHHAIVLPDQIGDGERVIIRRFIPVAIMAGAVVLHPANDVVGGVKSARNRISQLGLADGQNVGVALDGFL